MRPRTARSSGLRWLNAGGAWSAFGDITTLMVWQAHKVEFFEFFRIFLPSVVNWAVPALCMHFALPAGTPPPGRDDADVKYGGWFVCALFALTIAITVSGKQFLHMPPVFGMMAGLEALRSLSSDRMPAELLDDLMSSGHAWREVEVGDPGVVHDVDTPHADLPPYGGPPEPASGRTYEWGALAGEAVDEPVPAGPVIVAWPDDTDR